MKIETWDDALIEAKRIFEELKETTMPVTTFDKDYNNPVNYNCAVIQVNPFKSLEIDSEFEFYVVVRDEKKSFEHAFPYETVLKWKQ